MEVSLSYWHSGSACGMYLSRKSNYGKQNKGCASRVFLCQSPRWLWELWKIFMHDRSIELFIHCTGDFSQQSPTALIISGLETRKPCVAISRGNVFRFHYQFHWNSSNNAALIVPPFQTRYFPIPNNNNANCTANFQR